MADFKCETCGETKGQEELGGHPEITECVDCEDAYHSALCEQYRSLWEGERAAGLLLEKTKLDETLREAGRGELVAPW